MLMANGGPLPTVVSWGPGNVIVYTSGVVAAAAALWRASRGARQQIRHFIRELRAAVFDIRGWPAVVDPRTREIKSPALPGLGARMSQLEVAVRTSGQLADLTDSMRAARTEIDQAKRRANDAAVLAGEAATVAARNDQQLTEFREESRQRHGENTQRIDNLEDEVREARSREHKLLDVLHDVLHLDIRVEAAGQTESEGDPS